MKKICNKGGLNTLVRVGEASHAAHDSENVVVDSVDTDFACVDARNSVVREDELECGVVNS